MDNTPTTTPATAECAKRRIQARTNQADEWSGLNGRIAHAGSNLDDIQDRSDCLMLNIYSLPPPN